jgi:uncharacterized membrane protein
MSQKYIFIIIKYPQAGTANEALAALIELMQQKIVSLKDAIAVTKTEMGEVMLHRTQDELAGKGFLNGRLIGVIFADLFGSAGWDMNGALAGTAFAMLGQGIQDKLLNEFGEKMSPSESAVALLVERADWRKAVDSMRVHNFQGVIVISQNVIEDLTKVEQLLDDEKNVAPVPEKMEVPAPKGLKYVEGIGDAYRQKLLQAGITNVDELLERGSTLPGRQAIANQTGISEKLIGSWVSAIDLSRVYGIGAQFGELLQAAGVTTVGGLAQQEAAGLHDQLVAVNKSKNLVREVPGVSQVEKWIGEAKALPQVVTS